MKPNNIVNIHLSRSKATGRKPMKSTGGVARESLDYFIFTVRRLEIFTNLKLSTSLSLQNRLHLWKVFKSYMQPYEGKDEQSRPFLDIQIQYFKRALAGGILKRKSDG